MATSMARTKEWDNLRQPCSYGTGPGWCDGWLFHANKRAAVHGHPGLNVVNKIIDTPATFNVFEYTFQKVMGTPTDLISLDC